MPEICHDIYSCKLICFASSGLTLLFLLDDAKNQRPAKLSHCFIMMFDSEMCYAMVYKRPYGETR